MANIIAPRGFIPSRYMSGAAYNGATSMYYIPTADVNVYSPGDAVKSAAVSDANGTPGVTKAAGTDTVRGVIVGVLVANPQSPSLSGLTLDLTTQQVPAAKLKDYYVLVCDEPSMLFEIQDDGLSVLGAAAVNKNASFTVANPTSPQQNSASVLTTSSVAVTASLNLKLFGLVQRVDNAFGINAKWLVRFNQHELQGGTAGI